MRTLRGYSEPMIRDSQSPPAGELLRRWRHRRKLSQLELALDVDVSARHLSFVETGRALASREVLLRIADHLNIPLRARNALLLAGGYAPLYPERPIDAPALTAAKAAVNAILSGHEPFPAIAIDRHWNLVAANGALHRLIEGVSRKLLEPPVNVLRLSLHPEGLAGRIDNLPEWRDHLLERLRRQIDETADESLSQLLGELTTYPCPSSGSSGKPSQDIAVPLKLRLPGSDMSLSFLSTTTVFGTPVEVTLSELALECFYPADEATRTALTIGQHLEVHQ